MKKRHESSSWEPVSEWYDKTVGTKGHYYHEHVILPKMLKLLALDHHPAPSFLDLACGQGILSRHLPGSMEYLGVDASLSLIQSAKKLEKSKSHRFLVSDLSKPLHLPKKNYTHCAIVLALQNMADPKAVLQNAYEHLEKKAKLLLIVNHPCFRIPRQTSWQVDEEKKIQYRRVDRYLSPLKIPILAHPSKGSASAQTWSYHHSLSDYSHILKQTDFVIEVIEEWCSDKKSTGSKAKMEDRSREEFPLFLAILAQKL